MNAFADRPRSLIRYWLPPVLATGTAWVAFILAGNTPLIRASGLALVILGTALTLRNLGAIESFAGGLALAFSPAFWSQTGGVHVVLPATIVLAIASAGIISGLVITTTRRAYIALGVGMVIFALIFWSQIGTPRSLRLTGLLTAWLLFILVHVLRTRLPRADEAPTQTVGMQEYIGLLVILTLGVLNDPLFVLLLPATAIGLWLSHSPLPRWYWVVMAVVFTGGIAGIAGTYIDSDWWQATALDLHEADIHIRYIVADGWREGVRWVNLIELLVMQFTFAGAILAILGLTRMARWYPVLGIVLMLAFALYGLFGLVYFGRDRDILLTPLYIIQVIWITYAIHTMADWAVKSGYSSLRTPLALAYLLLPLYLLAST
jgi:hypothetical protein